MWTQLTTLQMIYNQGQDASWARSTESLVQGASLSSLPARTVAWDSTSYSSWQWGAQEGLTTVNPGCRAPDANSFTSPLHGAAVSVPSASDYREGENHLLQQAQQDCVISDLAHLKSDKPLLKSRRLLTAPELDPATQLICVGGPLCRSTQLENEMIHPIVLDT